MSRKAPAADVENAVADYVSGEGCQAVAARHGIGQGRLKMILMERGVWRTRHESDALKARRTSATVVAKSDLPTAEIARRYQEGESVKALAEAYGVSRGVIALRLTNEGVELRGQAEANRRMAAERTTEENIRNAAAAHAATRGVPIPHGRKVKSAATRERREIFVSPTERRLATMLAERGLEVTPQKAIGPYNVDIAAGSVAVEIFGGGWHAYGTHRARSAERFRYILDQGWNLVIIWVFPDRWPLDGRGADYVVSFVELASGDPSIRGQYRVIWGDGQEAPSVNLQVDDLSVKPSRSGRKRLGSRDQRAAN